MFKPLKNNKGAALAAVIIVMVVLMILGTATLTLAQSETNLSINHEKKVQAEGIAKSGADIAAKYYMDNPLTSVSSFSGTIGEGSYAAIVEKPQKGLLIITSVGSIDGVSATVTLELTYKTYTALFTGIRQTGTDDLDLSAMDISYEPGATVLVEANVAALDQITLSASDSADSNIAKAVNNDELESFELPAGYTNFQTSIPAIVGDTITMTGNYYLTSLDISGNKDNLVFNTNGQDMQVVVSTLSFTNTQGTITVMGGGSVHIYITESGDVQTPVTVTGSNATNLFIYVADGKTLSISANGEVHAYIYAPDAIVSIQSDQTILYGALIGQIINRGNQNGAHGNFHYVPLSEDPDTDAILPSYMKSIYYD